MHDPVWNAAQNKYVASDPRFVGAALPTRELSFANTVTLFKNVTVFALADREEPPFGREGDGVTRRQPQDLPPGRHLP